MNIDKALSSLFLFDGTDFTSLDEKYGITAQSTQRRCGNGELIMDADYSEGLPILLSGSARIISGDSERSAVLRDIAVGECFGAGTLFSSGAVHSTKVRSVEDGTVIVTLPFSLLSEILRGEAQCCLNYISFLSDRISFLNKKITAFTAGSAEAKLAVYLTSLETNSKGTAVLPTSISALSSQLGIGRASLYRALDGFEESGIIARNSKTVTLLKPDVLRSMIQ